MDKLKLALLEIVRLKAETLLENAQIRLIADMGYTLFNMKGALYIGYRIEDDSAGPFFPEKEVLTMETKGVVSHRLQKYFKQDHWRYVDEFRG